MNFSNLELSIVANYYFDQKAADSLYRMLDHYASFSKDLMSRIQFVLVDDHSKIDVPISKSLPLNYQLFRVNKDIFWNNGGARNLGVIHARTEKLLLTDIDHFFSEDLLRRIVNHKAKRNSFYKFKRVDINGKSIRSQPNILYMTKSVFFNALSYDEEFSGNYGSEDTFFLDVLKHKGLRLGYFSRWKKIKVQKVDTVNSYHSFSRDISVNQALRNKKLDIMKKHGVMAAHSRLFLNFDWSKIDEQMNVVTL